MLTMGTFQLVVRYPGLEDEKTAWKFLWEMCEDSPDLVNNFLQRVCKDGTKRKKSIS